MFILGHKLLLRWSEREREREGEGEMHGVREGEKPDFLLKQEQS